MTHRSFILGLAGGSGSGKTTIARNLVGNITDRAVPIISQDNYYRDLSHLPLEERHAVNFDHPDSIDVELLVEHIGRLRAGQAVDIPVYDFATHTRLDKTVRYESSPVIVLEGIFILVDQRLREVLDVRIYVDIDADVRFIRRLQRDVSERGRSLTSVIHQYEQQVRPMHLQFIEPSKRYADMIIPLGGHNAIAIDMVAAKIRTIMADQL